MSVHSKEDQRKAVLSVGTIVCNQWEAYPVDLSISSSGVGASALVKTHGSKFQQHMDNVHDHTCSRNLEVSLLCNNIKPSLDFAARECKGLNPRGHHLRVSASCDKMLLPDTEFCFWNWKRGQHKRAGKGCGHDGGSEHLSTWADALGGTLVAHKVGGQGQRARAGHFHPVQGLGAGGGGVLARVEAHESGRSRARVGAVLSGRGRRRAALGGVGAAPVSNGALPRVVLAPSPEA